MQHQPQSILDGAPDRSAGLSPEQLPIAQVRSDSARRFVTESGAELYYRIAERCQRTPFHLAFNMATGMPTSLQGATRRLVERQNMPAVLFVAAKCHRTLVSTNRGACFSRRPRPVILYERRLRHDDLPPHRKNGTAIVEPTATLDDVFKTCAGDLTPMSSLVVPGEEELRAPFFADKGSRGR